MATPFHTTVRLDGFRVEESILTYVVEGNVNANHVGRAVSMTANAGAVKLAGDGDTIIGRLDSVEAREDGTVGAVCHRFSAKMELAANSGVAIGGSVVGAGDGLVKAANAADHTDNVVVGLDATHAVVNRM